MARHLAVTSRQVETDGRQTNDQTLGRVTDRQIETVCGQTIDQTLGRVTDRQIETDRAT